MKLNTMNSTDVFSDIVDLMDYLLEKIADYSVDYPTFQLKDKQPVCFSWS